MRSKSSSGQFSSIRIISWGGFNSVSQYILQRFPNFRYLKSLPYSTQHTYVGLYLKANERDNTGKHWGSTKHPMRKLLRSLNSHMLTLFCLQLKPARSVQRLLTLGDLKAKVLSRAFMPLWLHNKPDWLNCLGWLQTISKETKFGGFLGVV